MDIIVHHGITISSYNDESYIIDSNINMLFRRLDILLSSSIGVQYILNSLENYKGYVRDMLALESPNEERINSYMNNAKFLFDRYGELFDKFYIDNSEIFNEIHNKVKE